MQKKAVVFESASFPTRRRLFYFKTKLFIFPVPEADAQACGTDLFHT